MKIEITERIRPFSHTPGAACLIPGTGSILHAFPTLLKIDSHEIKLNLTGPIADFTLLQDLEKHCLFILGKAQEGYYRIRVEGSDSGFDVVVEKGPLTSVRLEREVSFMPNKAVERLSLGCHKAQDWDLVQRRMDLREMLPPLFLLGQKIPLVPPQPLKGTARLLELPEERTLLAPALQAFFSAAFSKILVPRLVDDQHQGLALEEAVSGHPLYLVQQGAKMIRALFFKQNERRLAFLPALPLPLDSGKMIGIQAPGIGEIDFEWSKKLLRRVIIRPSTSGDVILELQKELKSFRSGKKQRQKGTEPLALHAGKTVVLDQFQK